MTASSRRTLSWKKSFPSNTTRFRHCDRRSLPYRKTISTFTKNPATSRHTAVARHPPPHQHSPSLRNPQPSRFQPRLHQASLDRYRSTYEANLSPFAAFRGRESARAYQRMSLPERFVFSITRMVLANRTSRNLFAFYCISLHVLIFIMLYWMHSTDIVSNASNLGETLSAAGTNPGADAVHGDWLQEGFEAGEGT